MTDVQITLSAFLLFIFISFLIWIGERKRWNGGICRKTGLPWIYFDTDSQGGRGYRSERDHIRCVTWISWPFVDHRYRRGIHD